MLGMWLGGNYHYQAKRGCTILKHHRFLSSVCVLCLNACMPLHSHTCVFAPFFVVFQHFNPAPSKLCACMCVSTSTHTHVDARSHPFTENSIWQGHRYRKWSIEQQLYCAAKDSLLGFCLSMELNIKPLSPHTQTNMYTWRHTHTHTCTYTHLWKRG